MIKVEINICLSWAVVLKLKSNGIQLMGKNLLTHHPCYLLMIKKMYVQDVAVVNKIVDLA